MLAIPHSRWRKFRAVLSPASMGLAAPSTRARISPAFASVPSGKALQPSEGSSDRKTSRAISVPATTSSWRLRMRPLALMPAGMTASLVTSPFSPRSSRRAARARARADSRSRGMGRLARCQVGEDLRQSPPTRSQLLRDPLLSLDDLGRGVPGELGVVELAHAGGKVGVHLAQVPPQLLAEQRDIDEARQGDRDVKTARDSAQRGPAPAGCVPQSQLDPLRLTEPREEL